jgi:hypothetical protein
MQSSEESLFLTWCLAFGEENSERVHFDKKCTLLKRAH